MIGFLPCSHYEAHVEEGGARTTARPLIDGINQAYDRALAMAGERPAGAGRER
jgi:hypothetical protein